MCATNYAFISFQRNSASNRLSEALRLSQQTLNRPNALKKIVIFTSEVPLRDSLFSIKQLEDKKVQVSVIGLQEGMSPEDVVGIRDIEKLDPRIDIKFLTSGNENQVVDETEKNIRAGKALKTFFYF